MDFLRAYYERSIIREWHLLQKCIYKGISDMNNFTFINTDKSCNRQDCSCSTK